MSPCLQTIPHTPRPQRASGPHRFTTAWAAIGHRLLCYYVPSLHICHSSGQGQGQEEHERRSQEGRSVPGPWIFLIVSSGAQTAGPLRPAVMMLSTAGILQPPVVMPGKEATHFRVEAMEHSEALVDRDVAGIRWELQLLVEDIMGEVEVVGG